VVYQDQRYYTKYVIFKNNLPVTQLQTNKLQQRSSNITD